MNRTIIRGVIAAATIGSAQRSAAQVRMEIMSPTASLALAPSLGVPLDSLISTPRGVYHHDLQLGVGDSVTRGATVSVHFVGFLADGRKFSATQPGKPYTFTAGAGQVIDGWEEGLLGVKVGGRRQLVIRPELGYGDKPMKNIPANSVLVFDITVVDVKR